MNLHDFLSIPYSISSLNFFKNNSRKLELGTQRTPQEVLGRSWNPCYWELGTFILEEVVVGSVIFVHPIASLVFIMWTAVTASYVINSKLYMRYLLLQY